MSNQSKYKSQGPAVVPGKQAILAKSPRLPNADLRNWFAELQRKLGTGAFPVFEVKRLSKKKQNEKRYGETALIEIEGKRQSVPTIFLTNVD